MTGGARGATVPARRSARPAMERRSTDRPLLEVRNLKTHFFTQDGVVKAVDPAGRLEIDLASRSVRVESAMSSERFAAAISRAGFSAVPATPA